MLGYTGDFDIVQVFCAIQCTCSLGVLQVPHLSYDKSLNIHFSLRSKSLHF